MCTSSSVRTRVYFAKMMLVFNYTLSSVCINDVTDATTSRVFQSPGFSSVSESDRFQNTSNSAYLHPVVFTIFFLPFSVFSFCCFSSFFDSS